MQLRRVNRIARGTVIRGDHCIARLEESRADSVQVRRTLGIVHAPGTTVSVDYNRIRIPALLGQVNIQRMVDFAIAHIIHIGKLFRVLHLTVAGLRAAKAPVHTAAPLGERRNSGNAYRHCHLFHAHSNQHRP